MLSRQIYRLGAVRRALFVGRARADTPAEAGWSPRGRLVSMKFICIGAKRCRNWVAHYTFLAKRARELARQGQQRRIDLHGTGGSAGRLLKSISRAFFWEGPQ